MCIEKETPYCGDEDHPYPIGDFTKDCFVGVEDLLVLATYWLEENCNLIDCDGTDLSGKGKVDLEDLAVFSNEWMKCTDPYEPCNANP